MQPKQPSNVPTFRLLGTSLVLGASLLGASLLPGCDNGATGVAACRRIEEARCELIKGCDGSLQSDDEVTACKLFYRDQCLFGVADGQAPDDVVVEACLKALGEARACETAGNDLASCSGAPQLRADSLVTTGCMAVAKPEDLVACAFLHPSVAQTGSAGGGGQSTGGGSDAGGQGGSGGSN